MCMSWKQLRPSQIHFSCWQGWRKAPIAPWEAWDAVRRAGQGGGRRDEMCRRDAWRGNRDDVGRAAGGGGNVRTLEELRGKRTCQSDKLRSDLRPETERENERMEDGCNRNAIG
ncbi:hypothetical protein Dda_3169 [Drechslerella dactyloides]|uniref:Uncharacterized protein n=1 Tax=Drechslerella dactyloides TaxID=74499 RepID=A0AAD6NK37_DREDA|nr:hypothetical protein Dda_3169 [Drechslerella dactyloides]